MTRAGLQTLVLAALALASARLVRADENSIGMALVRIEPGECLVGSPDDDPAGEPDERPQYRVRFDRAFYLGKFEVTQAQFERMMGYNPSWCAATGGGAADAKTRDTRDDPVDMVSWHEAVEFCRRLGELDDERRAGRSYRLPTEAEWEYACRAGTTTRFSFGDSLDPRQANIAGDGGDARPGGTCRVGSFSPNAFGLCDMHGNVWEWCADAYFYDAYRRTGRAPDNRASDLGEPEGTGHVVRGGDWQFPAAMARSANRDLTRASRRDRGNGFRVACDVR